MAIAPHKDTAQISVKNCNNGDAQLLISQGQIEVEFRLNADQVDDLQAELETVGHELEAWHRADEKSAYADMVRLRNE